MVRSFTQAPAHLDELAGALISAAWPTAANRSRWPWALDPQHTRTSVLRIDGTSPRSTGPAKASVAVVTRRYSPLTNLRRNRCGPLYQRYGRPVGVSSSTGDQQHLEADSRAQPGQGADQRALAEKTVSNGCARAEAMAAAGVGRCGCLSRRYALSMERGQCPRAASHKVEVPIGGKRRRPIDACVTAIVRFCDCKVWVSTRHRDAELCVLRRLRR